MLNAARGLAKLSLHEATRRALHGDGARLSSLLAALLEARKRSAALAADGRPPVGLDAQLPGVVVRLAFCLGNLTAAHDGNRAILGAAGAGPLVDALAASAASFLAAGGDNDDGADDDGGREGEQVLIKLIRLVANVSIHPEMGDVAAHGTGAAALLPLLEASLARDREELALNVVSCVTNLSYYVLRRPGSPPPRRGRGSLFGRPATACAALLGALLHENAEAVSEAARAFGNLSRDASFRAAMRETGADEALVLLLGHASRAVLESITARRPARGIFKPLYLAQIELVFHDS